MSSLYKGLAENYSNTTSPNLNVSDGGEVFIAQVINVFKNTSKASNNTTAVDNPYELGLIQFNRANITKKPEKSIGTVAAPLDRSNYRLPMAGEQVLIVRKLGFYFYFDVVSPVFSMLSNVDPTLLENAFESSGAPRITVDPDVEAIRFEVRNDFKQETLSRKTYIQTKPREGETILEGRMGGVIKLTHTNTKEGVWSKEKQITNIGESIDGDPMLLMKATKRRNDAEKVVFSTTALEDDDVNVDASSLYLTTTQNIPVAVNCSSTMYSWNVSIQRGEFGVGTDPSTRYSAMFPEQTYDPSFVPSVNVSGLEALANSAGGGMVSGVNDSGVPGSNAKSKSIDELKTQFQSLGYNWPGGMHLVGIRSTTNINTGGGVTTKNSFADLVGFVDETVSPPTVKFFPATTVPGKSYLQEFYPGQDRTAILMPGQYQNAFSVGTHISYEAFRQSTTFGIFNDRNRDDVPDSTPNDTSKGGNYGINLHRAAANGIVSRVDNFSAGCQVVQDNSHLQEMLRAAKAATVATGTKAFTYTLLMSF